MIYQSILQKAVSRKAWIKQVLKKLKTMPLREVDSLFHTEHEKTFEKINCLSCANCCKTTGPLFTNRDIDTISRHLRIKPSQFIEQYLRIDEEKDYVLKSTPCIFLDEANYCSIYDYRPKACREFPHTDRANMNEISHLTSRNALICPAVYTILENIETRLQKKT